MKPATLADAAELAANLRQADRLELWAAGRDDMHEVIAEGVRASRWSFTVRSDGALVCIFGLSSMGTLLAPIGVPWMLGTTLVALHTRALMQQARPCIAAMQQEFPHLLNVVHAKNKEAVRFLKRVGFTLRPAAPYGPHGESFHVFEVNHV